MQNRDICIKKWVVGRNGEDHLSVIVEPDYGGFIAKMPDLPVYGYGDDREEAINNLKIEIESLYEDLMQDDNFTDEWLQIKEFLKKRVAILSGGGCDD
jgi:predicted RNase H-like HicB family nuclease